MTAASRVGGRSRKQDVDGRDKPGHDGWRHARALSPVVMAGRKRVFALKTGHPRLSCYAITMVHRYFYLDHGLQSAMVDASPSTEGRSAGEAWRGWGAAPAPAVFAHRGPGSPWI